MVRRERGAAPAEIAPQIALDRACHTRMAMGVWTPAGSFTGCVQIDETTPLEPDDLSIKRYCPGVGLVYDDGIRLVEGRLFTDFDGREGGPRVALVNETAVRRYFPDRSPIDRVIRMPMAGDLT